MNKLSVSDKIVIYCILFLVQALTRNSNVFYNYQADHFIAEVKKVMAGKEENENAEQED